MAIGDSLDQLRIDRSAPHSPAPWGRRLALLAAAVVLVGVGWWLAAGVGAVEVDTVLVAEASGERPAGGGSSVLDASGYVVARRQATVSSKITGRLVEVTIEEGMAVTQGQILARLDDANARRALELAEAQLVAAKSELTETEVRRHEAELKLRRVRELGRSGVESQQALDEAVAARDSLVARLVATRADVAVAERELAVRQQDLEDTLIRAPFDGVAISKDAQPGEIVSPMSAGGGFTRTGVSTIVDMRSLEIEVDVNESFIQRVKDGQPVVATLDAYPDWKIPARVITTVPAADRQKATVKVRIGFDELGDPRILSDMGVKVAFQADAQAAEPGRPRLVVPKNAVRRSGSTAVVYVLRNDTVERRAVAVGGTTGDTVEVLSGVRSGDRLVLDPPADLADGSRVRARNDEG
jgi:RND family efflux transporter MFP subunit